MTTEAAQKILELYRRRTMLQLVVRSQLDEIAQIETIIKLLAEGEATPVEKERIAS